MKYAPDVYKAFKYLDFLENLTMKVILVAMKQSGWRMERMVLEEHCPYGQ